MNDKDSLAGVKHVILILSGKGGVGKSTFACSLALALRKKNANVGILDLDLCGPSIPKMLKLKGKKIHQCNEGWIPVFADHEKKLGVMSIGFLLENQDSAVVWRGPKKNAMIKQFIKSVFWQDLDFLIIDTPPGTSDEHISIVEILKDHKMDGAVLVTTPQNISTGDVRREYTFCHKTQLPVLGLVENMSGFICPHCSECTNIFSSGGGAALASELNIPFLGAMPVSDCLGEFFDNGVQLDNDVNAPVSDAIEAIIQNLTHEIDK